MRLSQLLEKLATRLRDKRLQEFREFLDAYYASHAWTLLKCPMCERPAPEPDAKFCVSCGASMSASHSRLHPLLTQERTTGPVQIQKRPLLAYLELEDEMKKRNTGPHTQLHRAVHLQKEKAGLKHG